MTLGSGGGAIAFANSAAPATLTLAGSGAGVLGASVGDSGVSPNFTSLVKMGTGAWTLAGGNSYSGTTAVSAGVLYINGVNATSGPTIISGGALYIEGSNATTSISVAGGTVLGGTGSVTSAGANVANGGTLDFSHNAGNTFSLGGLTFAGHATINVDALSNYTASPVLSTGALTPSSTTGQITIDANLGAATLLSGTYDLISYKGAIGGAGLPAFTVTVNGIGTRQTATLVNAANQIDLVVKGNTPYWNGNQSDWRAANAWTLQPSNSATTFQTGDTDIFDDTANGSTFGGNVALNIGNVAPASVTFNNNALAYTVSGSYGITGSATLTVNGPGTVTIANSNGYTGATTLAGGALNLANPSAIGSGPLNLNGGVLDNTSGSAMALSHNNPQNWNGDFTFNGSNNLNLGTGAVTLGSSRNVTINANTLTVGGLISDGGQGYGFNLNGGGTLVLTASNTYIGPTTISGGTLQLGSGAIGNDGSINGTALVTNNSTLAYNLAGTQTAGYAIGGFGSLVLGSGNLTLLGNNSYSGGTTINGGTLSIGNSQVNGTFGTGQYNIAAGARLYLNYATAVPASNGWSNNISGSGTLELNSAQAVNGSANWGPNSASATVFGPSFTGTLQVDNGRIDSSPEGLGGVSNIIINNGAQFLAWSGTYSMPVTIAGYGWGESGQVGALRAAGNAVTTWAGPITLSNNAGIEAQAGSSFTLTGPITGNYQVDFESNGAGTASVAPSGTNQNSYLSTEIDPGVIVVAGNQYAFSTGALLMNFGTLELDGFNFSFAHVLGSGAIGNYGSNPATLTVGSDNTNTVYGGSLVDGNGGASLNLTKIGSGKLTLTAINTYSGWTTVSSGILQLGNSAALGTSSLAADGGTLDLAGYSATVSSFSGAAGVVSNSVTGTLATLTFNQLIDTTFSGSIMDGRGQVAFDLQGSGTLTLTGTNTFTGGTTVAGGELILANSEALADGSSLTVGNVSLFGISMPANADHGIAAPVSPSVAAVPEPGTLVLVVASAVIAIGVWRRKALRA
jgi:autotransporter-associated beta strand protein